MVPLRRLLPVACALLALALAADEARAEDVFVLENGVVLRGVAARETGDQIVIRLAGLSMENTITVRKNEVVRRFQSAGPATVSVDPLPALPTGYPLTPYVPPGTTHYGPAPAGPTTTAPRPTPGTDAFDEATPHGEPSLQSEGFFERLKRVTGLALPKSFEGLLLVAFLAFVVLTVLVAGGTRALGMKAPSLHASSSLGLLLGIFLAADFLLHSEVLRADRALWILPLQALVWLAVARTALDAPLAKTVPLFAFVLFGSTCFIFFTGSVLVSV